MWLMNPAISSSKVWSITFLVSLLISDAVSDGKQNERKDSDEPMEVEINVDTPRPPR